MLWNEGSNFRVEILTTSDYSIHTLVKVLNQSYPFLLTAIYASPNFNKRKILWNYLKNLASSVNHHSVPPQMDYSLALSPIQGPHEAKRGSLLFELGKMTVVHLHAFFCVCVCSCRYVYDMFY